MSSVRMCDACGIIFSEKEEGWATAPVTRRIRNPRTGRLEDVTEDEDRCPRDAGRSNTHLVPQVALPGIDDVVQ